jgi:uncharacterized membrane protein YoaK (UPF0700 family)
MITRLPRWTWVCAWELAFVAGTINVVGLLGFARQPVSHLTGTTSMLGAALASGNAASALHFAAMIGFFVLGCVASGFIVQDSTLKLGRRYGAALLLVALLLLICIPLLERGSLWGMYAAAGACGLQNAMVSTYSGTVIRTTHVSGMFTDLGIFLGHVLRGVPVDVRRLRLCAVVICGFLCGGIVGAAAFRAYSYSSLLLPAFLTASVAVSYGIYRLRTLSREPGT